jgi:hypothetical protein
MIEVIANDRLGKKVRVKCDSEDTVGDLKVQFAVPDFFTLRCYQPDFGDSH